MTFSTKRVSLGLLLVCMLLLLNRACTVSESEIRRHISPYFETIALNDLVFHKSDTTCILAAFEIDPEYLRRWRMNDVEQAFGKWTRISSIREWSETRDRPRFEGMNFVSAVLLIAKYCNKTDNIGTEFIDYDKKHIELYARTTDNSEAILFLDAERSILIYVGGDI